MNNYSGAIIWNRYYNSNAMMNYDNLSEEERKALYYLISKTVDELKNDEQKEHVTSTLYADNIPVCEVIDDKPYWYKEVAQCKIEDIQKTVDELKQAQRDTILSSLNVYGPTYSSCGSYKIKKCPICGRDPEVIYHEAYDVYDIQCKSEFLKSPHLFVFGLADESKKDVVDRWNKLVLEYEIDQEDNDHPCWLRRYF